MFLIERLIGVSIYAFCILIFCTAIKKIKGVNIHLNIYCIILAAMGFFYVPLSGSDLGRIQLAMHSYANLSFNELINLMSQTSSPLTSLYYYIIGNLGDDRLLPCISAFITYSFCFGIIKSLYKCKHVYKNYIAISLIFFMSRGLFMMTIANIKTMLCLSIIAFAIFKISFEKKSFIKYSVLLIIGALIHNVGMLATLLYFIFYAFMNKANTNKIVKFIQITFIALLGIYYGKNYFLLAIEKGGNYLEASRNFTGYFYIWEFILTLIVLIVNLYCIILFFRIKKKNNVITLDKSLLNFVRLIMYFTVLDIALIFIEFNSGFRLSLLISIIDIPFIIEMLNCNMFSSKIKKRLKLFILCCSFLMLFISCSRGDLCSLKFS